MEEESQISPQPKKKFRKLKRAFFILMSLFIIVIITGVVLANVYEKEIKQYAIDEINSHLKAKIKINEDNISFSFFKKFPKASLNFADLLIEDENRPRYPNIKWYLDAVGFDFAEVIKIVTKIPRLYQE